MYMKRKGVSEQTKALWAGLEAEWASDCQRWGIELLEEIPIPSRATAKDWRGCLKGTTEERGKNHPALGAWLLCRYSQSTYHVYDPSIGVGGLFLSSYYHLDRITGIDCEDSLVNIAKYNLVTAASLGLQRVNIYKADAIIHRLPYHADLILTSHPFWNSHSSGNTDHQKEIIKKKKLYNHQEFRGSQNNLGNCKDRLEFWSKLQQVYYGYRDSLGLGQELLLILRNHIKQGQVVDEIAKAIFHLRHAGFHVHGAHPRRLLPVGQMQWKVSKDPTTPFTRTEWTLVCEAI